MARAHTNPEPVAEVRLYLQGVAKSLVDRLYGPDGPPLGTTLSTLENAIDLVRGVLSEQMLQQALSRQARACAAGPPEALACPGCQRPTEPADDEARDVATTVGRAAWCEPRRYCGQCRRAFFPSVAPARP